MDSTGICTSSSSSSSTAMTSTTTVIAATAAISQCESSSSYSESSTAITNGESNLTEHKSASTEVSKCAVDVESIQDENLLREMWVEAQDGESKRQIRSRMYKLREERLKDFYNREGILENILKEDQQHLEEKQQQGESTSGVAVITSKTTTTIVGNNVDGNGTITKTTTCTITAGGLETEDNDADTKDLERAKAKSTVGQSRRNQPTSTKMSVSKKNSVDLNGHSNGSGNDVVGSKQQQISNATRTQSNLSYKSVNNKELTSTRNASNGNGTTNGSAGIKGHAVTVAGTKNVTVTKDKIALKGTNSLGNGHQLSDRNGSTIKKTSLKRNESSQSQHEDSASRKFTSSSVNSMKISKGLTSPPSTRKGTKTTPAVNEVVDKPCGTVNLPRFMSTTKSREIGIASRQEVYNLSKSNTSNGKCSIQKQDSSSGSAKGKLTVAKSVSNGSTSKYIEFPKDKVTSTNGTSLKSRGNSPQVFKSGNRKDKESHQAAEKRTFSLQKCKPELHSEIESQSRDDTINAKTSTSVVATNKTEESIIKELDSLDNYLYQRSKSIEDKEKGKEKFAVELQEHFPGCPAASSPPPIIIIGSADEELQTKQHANLNSESKQKKEKQLENYSRTFKSGSTRATHAKQIEHVDEKSQQQKMYNKKSNRDEVGDVMVTGVEPIVTKTKAALLCNADQGGTGNQKTTNNNNKCNTIRESNITSNANKTKRETDSSAKSESSTKKSSSLSNNHNGNATATTMTKKKGLDRVESKGLKKDEMSVESQIIIPTSNLSSGTRTIASGRKDCNSNTTRVSSSVEESSTSRYSASSFKTQSQQEKYDADILSRPSVFDKKKFDGTTATRLQGQRARTASGQKSTQSLSRQESQEKTTQRKVNKEKASLEQEQSDDVELRQHKIVKKDSPKDYSDNEKDNHPSNSKTNASSRKTDLKDRQTQKQSQRPNEEEGEDDEDNDNPLKIQTKRSNGHSQRNSSYGHGSNSVLKAKSLFETKAHEASMDKSSTSFASGTSFKVNRKAAIFEARSRGERVSSISSESESHVTAATDSDSMQIQKKVMKISSDEVASSRTERATPEKGKDTTVSAAIIQRRRCSAELVDTIEDLSQLESMLYEATDYDERSRIRARIRTVKRQNNLGKGGNETSSPNSKKSYKARKSSEEIIARTCIEQATTTTVVAEQTRNRRSSSRKSSGDGTSSVTSIRNSPERTTNANKSARKISNESNKSDSKKANVEIFIDETSRKVTDVNRQEFKEGSPWQRQESGSAVINSSQRKTSTESAKSSSRKSSAECGSKIEVQASREIGQSQEREIPRKKKSVERKETCESIGVKVKEENQEATTERKLSKERREKILVSSKELKLNQQREREFSQSKSRSATPETSGGLTKDQKPTENGTTTKYQRSSKIVVGVTKTNENSVTSGYGVGPVDEDGTPLFGLRALRKLKKEQQNITAIDGTAKQERESSPGTDESVDIRDSNLYGLRALKHSHQEEEKMHKKIAEVSSSSMTARKTTMNATVGNETGSPAAVEKQSHSHSPTPPPVNSPKSILKKTSSFSSNKSESKSDLNVEKETGVGSSSASSYSAAADQTISPRIGSPIALGTLRSRSSSGDEDWKRKCSSETNVSHSVATGSFSRGRVGRSSVKEISKRFEQHAAGAGSSASDDVNTASRLLSMSNQALGGGNITYTKHKRIEKTELKDTEEREVAEGPYEDKMRDESREEEDGRVIKTERNTTTSRSFLNDRTPASNLTDVLERMKGEAEAEGEEEAARSLLNKFIGAQILLTGVETLVKGTAHNGNDNSGVEEVASVTSTTAAAATSSFSSSNTMSHVINGIDIDKESDSDKLRRLLNDCDEDEARGRIETRLKTLGSGSMKSVEQASSMKMAKSLSKQSSSSADVTGELMPLILGQLQNSLHNLSSAAVAVGPVAPSSTESDGKDLSQYGVGHSHSNSTLADGNNSTASSPCNSNNNSSATLVQSSSAQQCAEGEDGRSGSPDNEDDCLFDSGTESGEDAPPVSSTSSSAATNNKPPCTSSSASTLSSSATNNTNANKLVSKTLPRKKSDLVPGTAPADSASSGEFTSFMEGLRHSLQQSASALVLSSTTPPAKDSKLRSGKGIAIGGGRTNALNLKPVAAVTPNESDLIQQVDSVLSLLKESLVKDPNYLEKHLADSVIIDSTKGNELIALIDRLKSSLQSSDNENRQGPPEAGKEKKAEWKSPQEPKPPDLQSRSKGKNHNKDSLKSQKKIYSESKCEKEEREQLKESDSSLLDEVPWKIRAAKKRAQGRSRSIGVSQEELEEARRYLQEEAFRSALKEGEKNKKGKGDAVAGSKLKSIPGYRPMSWRADLLNLVPSPFVPGNQDPNSQELKLSSIDDSTFIWNKFGILKQHKPFRTLSLDPSNVLSSVDAASALVDDDPSMSLFTPEEVVQIEIHRAAIKKQMSEEEDRRRRRNSASSLQSFSEGGRSPKQPRDFTLTLPKPYANPNNNYISAGNVVPPGNRPPTQRHNNSNQETTNSSLTTNAVMTSTANATEGNEESQQMVIYDHNNASSSSRSTPTPSQSPTKRSSIDNVQISLKELTSTMFPQLQIAITVNTNNGNVPNNEGGPPASSTIQNSTNPRMITATAGGNSTGTGNRGPTPFKSSNNVQSDSNSGGSSSGGNSRYKNKTERKRRMKRANTIDIPQPHDYFGNVSDEGEGDGEDEDDELMSDYSNSGKSKTNPSVGMNPISTPVTTSMAAAGAVNPHLVAAASSSNLGFNPKTEKDKKFFSFLEKNNDQAVKSSAINSKRFNRPLSHLHVGDSHFSNLKTSFESSTSQGTSPSVSPIPSTSSTGGVSPSAHKHLINPEDVLIAKQPQNFSSKPIWAATKSDPLIAKSPQSVKNKLQVFEANDANAVSALPPQESWKTHSSEVTTYRPQPQTKPSSLLAKKESFEKFVEEHSQSQMQNKPVPSRNKPKPLVKQANTTDPPANLPPKAGGVHIVHATKSAIDAMARQRFSPVPVPIQPSYIADTSSPSSTARARTLQQFKSLPSSLTVEKTEIPWNKGSAAETHSTVATASPVPSAVPQFTNPKIQMSREMFEAKQREAVLAPVPHPPPTTHVNVTTPIQQQKLYARPDIRSFEDDGVAVTGRGPYISVKKLDHEKLQSFQREQSSLSPSPGEVEKVSIVFQPISHGKSLGSSLASYQPLPQGGTHTVTSNLHPKLAVFGVTRSIDDDRSVKGRLELESNRNSQISSDEGINQGILNSTFTPNKTSAFVARKFEGSKNIEPLQIRRQSNQPSSEDQTGSSSPTPTLISPVVSKVMKGPQQQRAIVTRKDMSSLGPDHPSAHRIRGESSNNETIQQTPSQPNTDTARTNIKALLGQFQPPTTNESTKPLGAKPVSSAPKVFHRQGGSFAPSLPLKKSHSGDALLQTHFRSHHKAAQFIPSTIEQSPEPQQVKFQPFQGHGFVQARSRLLEQQSVPSQPVPQKPQQNKTWGSQGFTAGGIAPSTNPVIPRQRSLSSFPPSQPSVVAQPVKPSPKVFNLSSFVPSSSSPSTVNTSSPPTNVNRIRFPIKAPQEDDEYSKPQRRLPHPLEVVADTIQRTSSGSSIFDRTKSLYICTQDALGVGVKPKRQPPPSALPKSKSLFPKQYEAQMSPESADQKKKEIEAYFLGKQSSLLSKEAKGKPTSTSASSHYRKLRHQHSNTENSCGSGGALSYATRIRKSASQGKITHRQRSYSDGDEDDVDKIFDSLFKSSVESKIGKGGEHLTSVTASAMESRKKQQAEVQCQVQKQAASTIAQSAGIDGSSSSKTMTQQSSKSSTSFKSASSSSTASATSSVTSSSSSPFSKFKQLDQQNSPSTGNKSGPLFKFTNEALKTSAGSAKDVLLYWCQCRVRDYQNVKIENFSSSWSDGLAFCALIHHFYPDAFDYSKLDPRNRKHNFELAFRVADEQAGIYPLLDVEDMMIMGKKPDWKCVFTYVQSMYAKLRQLS